MKTKLTICDYVLQMPDRGTKEAIRFKKGGKWVSLNWMEYFEKIERVALGLLELGISADDKVALVSSTRYEWTTTDYAIMGIGAINVPIYQTSTADDLEHILNDCQAKVIIIEDKHVFKTFRQVQSRCPLVETIVSFEDVPAKELPLKYHLWDEVMALGTQRKQINPTEYQSMVKSIDIDDTATILYTSGTTGRPKGVVLTHQQIISEVSEAWPYVGANENDISLAFLPYSHILGRVEHFGHVFVGHPLAFAESIERVRLNLRDVQPTYLVSVPRIFEKIYGAIWAQAESNIASSKIFRWAVTIGLKAGQYRMRREPLPIHLVAQYELAKRLALNKVKEAFGGRLRFAISGGAPLARDIALFFHACEILILEGYGLTETTAAVAVNAPFDYKFGTVGKPIGDVQFKIAEDGEILVKSKKVMKEYFNNPEETAQVIKDGWFHTGDIGEIGPAGELKITDRKKDLIKTAGGKYVAPQRIEGFLKSHPLISHALIHGDQKKYIVALFTLEKQQLLQIAKDKNIQYKDYADLTQNPVILEQIRRNVAEINSHLASFETIKRFAILPSDFSVEDGELTPSLKVKRKFLDKKFKKQIESLYQ
jgi:long-chain acyl-CoA synthetase